MGGTLQNGDFKTLAELQTAGGGIAQLLNATKVYDGKNATQLSVSTRKNNDSAVADPLPTNDGTQGYEKGSRWIYDGKTYTCVDNTTNNAVWTEGGGGGGVGSASIYLSLSADSLSNFDDVEKGNDILPMGGGVAAGLLEFETVAPLNGSQSFKYTQAAGSLNDYYLWPIVEVPLRARGKNNLFELPFKYDGADDDIDFILYDETNNKILVIGEPEVKNTSKSAIFSGLFYMPESTTQIRVGFQVKSENIGKILIFDDFELDGDGLAQASFYNTSDWIEYTPIFTGLGSVTNIKMKYKRLGDSVKIFGSFTTGASTAVEASISLPNGIKISASIGGKFSAGTYVRSPSSDQNGGVLLAEDGDGILNMSPLIYSADVYSVFGEANGNHIGSSTTVSIDSTLIKIDGWETSSDALITSISGIENSFSARIQNNGAGTLLSQNGGNAFGGVARTAAGRTTVTLTSGQFSELPSVMVTPLVNNAAQFTAQVISASLTEIVVLTGFDNGTDSDCDYSITLTNQGTDYKPPTAYALIPNTVNLEDTAIAVGGSSKLGNAVRFATGVSNSSLFDVDHSLGYTRFIAKEDIKGVSTNCFMVSNVGLSTYRIDINHFNSSGAVLRNIHQISTPNGNTVSGTFDMAKGEWLGASTPSTPSGSSFFTATAKKFVSGIVATSKTEIYKHVKNCSSFEKVIGEWFGQPLYEISYSLLSLSSGNTVIDPTFTNALYKPRNNWGSNIKTIFYDGTHRGDLQVGAGGLSTTLTAAITDLSLIIQYTKISENP